MVANIRKIESDDFERIIALLEQLWPDKELNRNALLKIFSASVRSPNILYLCAEIEGSVIGFCSIVIRESLWVEGPFAHIDELIIDDKHRRRGVGAVLLGAALTAAKKRGCRLIELDSAFYREDAHRFYSREGFEKKAYLFLKELNSK